MLLRNKINYDHLIASRSNQIRTNNVCMFALLDETHFRGLKFKSSSGSSVNINDCGIHCDVDCLAVDCAVSMLLSY